MLHYRKSLGLRISSSRKLGLEPLEDRSMPSVVTAALLPSTSPADNTSTSAVPTDASTALVADAKDTASEPALLPLTQAQAAAVSSATAANTSKSLAAAVDRVLLMDINQPPVITEFGAVEGLNDYWTFFGTVSDPDDDMAGMVVVFGGVLQGYNVTATVNANGAFSVTQVFSDLSFGCATAQTQDPHGALSNVAECWVFPS